MSKLQRDDQDMDIPPDMMQTLINWIFAAGGAAVAWYTDSVRRQNAKTDQRMSDIERQHHQQAIVLAGDYVKRHELQDLSQAIFAKLDRIESKIDRKADKTN